MTINDLTSRVVNMFCSTEDSFSKYLWHPSVQWWYMYATDRYTVIRVPTELDNTPKPSSLELPIQKQFPFDTVVPYFEKPVLINYPVEIYKIKILMDNFPRVPVLDYTNMVDCPKCKGSGEVECDHCGSDYECPNCDGSWEIGKPRDTGETQFADDIYVIVNDLTCISGKYLIRCYEVALELGQDTIDFQFISTDKSITDYNVAPLMVGISDAVILIMPLKTSRSAPVLGSTRVTI